MAIRPRISDPYGDDYKQFEQIKKYGRPPKAPRKPGAEERKPVIELLAGYPLGGLIRSDDYPRWATKFVTSRYHLFGIDICFYPTGRRTTQNDFIVTGLMVLQLSKNRNGVSPKTILKSEEREIWYGNIIRWIDETRYGG